MIETKLNGIKFYVHPTETIPNRKKTKRKTKDIELVRKKKDRQKLKN